MVLLAIGTRWFVFPGMQELPSFQFTPTFAGFRALINLKPAYLFVIINGLLMLQALLLNRLCERHGIMQAKTWLPGILLFLLSGMYPWQYSLLPHHFTNFILLLLIHFIASLYENELKIDHKLMDIGLIFCLLPLVSSEGWYFLIFVIVAVSLFIFYDLDRIFLLALSIVMPLLLFAGICFITGNQYLLWALDTGDVSSFGVNHLIQYRAFLGPLMYPAALGIWGLAMIQGGIGLIPSKTRKIYYTFLSLMILDALISAFGVRNFFSNIALMPLPLSIFVAYFFIYMRSTWLKELFFLVLILLIIFTQLIFRNYF